MPRPWPGPPWEPAGSWSTCRTVAPSWVKMKPAPYTSLIVSGLPSLARTPSAPLAPSGTDAYMNVPNSTDFDFGSAFSFEIWVNPGANPFVTYRAIACNTLYPSQGWLLATVRGPVDASGQSHALWPVVQEPVPPYAITNPIWVKQ